jgi:hypothetical protein
MITFIWTGIQTHCSRLASEMSVEHSLPPRSNANAPGRSWRSNSLRAHRGSCAISVTATTVTGVGSALTPVAMTVLVSRLSQHRMRVAIWRFRLFLLAAASHAVRDDQDVTQTTCHDRVRPCSTVGNLKRTTVVGSTSTFDPSTRQTQCGLAIQSRRREPYPRTFPACAPHPCSISVCQS